MASVSLVLNVLWFDFCEVVKKILIVIGLKMLDHCTSTKTLNCNYQGCSANEKGVNASITFIAIRNCN